MQVARMDNFLGLHTWMKPAFKGLVAFMVPLWLVGLFCCYLPKKGWVYITI